MSSYRKFTFAISSPDEFLVLPATDACCWQQNGILTTYAHTSNAHCDVRFLHHTNTVTYLLIYLLNASDISNVYWFLCTTSI